MADILSVPAEFSTILVGFIEPGTYHAYGEKRLVPRPPLGPFTHHAVQTFAKTCSEGQIGLNWRDHLVRALKAWKSLRPEEFTLLSQAADRDKQRYAERVELAGREGAEELLQFLEEKKLRTTGAAPSAFDLFKNSHETRSRLYDAKEGSIDYHEFYGDKVFIWLWGLIDGEEKSRWRQEARRRLDIRNNARRMKGEAELLLDTEPQQSQEGVFSPGKPKRLVGPQTGPSEEDVNTADDVEGEADDDEYETYDDADEAEDDDEENTGRKAQSADAEGISVDDAALQWTRTEDENLTPHEKQLLNSIPPNLRRWDRFPRAARNAYTLFYADRLTSAASPHFGNDPHCPTTRAQIHAEWESTEADGTHEHFENLAASDQLEFDRQSREHSDWHKAWWDLELRFLLRKVIDRWRPHSSFGADQTRLRADIPRRPQDPRAPLAVDSDDAAVDYALPCLHYPVIRTDYSNGAVYEHLRHVLLNSRYVGDPVRIEMTFYDGLQSPSPSIPVAERDELPSLARDDPRADDYEWCRTNFEHKSLDDLKAAFGELAFHGKEHVPIYTFGGHAYAIVIDSQSMKDGTVKFVSLSSFDFADTRPEHRPGPDGAWEQDPTKEWYLAPRVQAADVVIELINLDIANIDWNEFVQHRSEKGLDLLSDPSSRQWRGWQLAIEYVFGGQALENVVGVVETLPSEACLPHDDEDEEEYDDKHDDA